MVRHLEQVGILTFARGQIKKSSLGGFCLSGWTLKLKEEFPTLLYLMKTGR